MKVYKKNIINIILTFIFICTFMQNTYATEIKLADKSTMGGIISDGDDFLSNGTSQESPINDSALKSGSSTLYNVLVAIGVGVVVIWGVVIGIQFVTGTLEDKAEMKKSLVPYIIGCVIIFGAFGIWRLVLNLLNPLAQ